MSKIGIDLSLPVPQLLTRAGFDLVNIDMDRFHELIGYMSLAKTHVEVGIVEIFGDKDPSGIVAGIPVARNDMTDAQFRYVLSQLMVVLWEDK